MTEADKIEFARILSGLSEIRGKALSKSAMAMYWLALSGWEMEDFRQAAKHLLSTCQFMPTPYDFEQLRKSSQETSGEAWARVRQAIRHRYHGASTSLDPKIDKIVGIMGGWDRLGMTNSDEMHFREKRFAELWDEISDVEEVRAALPYFGPDPVDNRKIALDMFSIDRKRAAITAAQPISDDFSQK